MAGTFSLNDLEHAAELTVLLDNCSWISGYGDLSE